MVLQSCRMSFVTGELNDGLVKLVPTLVGITPDCGTSA